METKNNTSTLKEKISEGDSFKGSLLSFYPEKYKLLNGLVHISDAFKKNDFSILEKKSLADIENLENDFLLQYIREIFIIDFDTDKYIYDEYVCSELLNFRKKINTSRKIASIEELSNQLNDKIFFEHNWKSREYKEHLGKINQDGSIILL